MLMWRCRAASLVCLLTSFMSSSWVASAQRGSVCGHIGHIHSLSTAGAEEGGFAGQPVWGRWRLEGWRTDVPVGGGEARMYVLLLLCGIQISQISDQSAVDTSRCSGRYQQSGNCKLVKISQFDQWCSLCSTSHCRKPLGPIICMPSQSLHRL